MPARLAFIRGHVQGVGFRAFVVELAHRHGVEGEVWNQSDGAVGVSFEHSDASMIDSFAEGLHRGPGRIDQIEIHVTPERGGWNGFHVGPTRRG